MDKDNEVEISEKIKETLPSPTHWSIYQCILGLSKRVFKLEKAVVLLIIISLINLLITILKL